MPKVSQYDIYLNNQGLMLARSGQLGRGGRAWQVETVGSSIAQRTPIERQFGNQEAVVEAPMVWRTAHRGYGDAEEQGVGRYYYAENMDARFPEQLLPGPLVTSITTGCNADVVKFAEHGGKLFALGGRYVKEIKADDTAGDALDLTAGKVGVDMEVFNDNLYVGLGFGAGDFIHRRTAAGAWSQDDDVLRGYMVTARDRLWATNGAASVISVDADPMVATNWTGAYTIGDPGVSITCLAMLADLLYIGKTEGPYALDNSGIETAIAPELRAFAHADNCKHLRAWHGILWAPHIRGLYACQLSGAFNIASVQPGREVDTNCPVRGRVTALAGDDKWLYAALYTISGDTWLLAGREPQDDTEAAFGRMVWHPLARLAGVVCRAMHLSHLFSSPRLYFGLGADVAYITLPRYGDNPRQDSACRYATSGSMYYSSACWDSPTTTKVFKSIELITENLSPTRYVDVYYRLDGGPWVLAGRAIHSPRYAISLGAQGVAGKRIEVYPSVHGGGKTPAIIKVIVVRAAERAEQVEMITFVVRCADGLPLNTGGRCPRSGAQILASLKALATANTAVPLKDVVGLSRQVLVLPPVDEQELEAEAGQNREVLATVRAAVFAVQETEWVTFKFAIAGTAGGMEIPLDIPWAVGTSVLDLYQTLPCQATENVRPVIVAQGPVTDLIIEDTTTGKTLDFTGCTIAAGDSYTIDLTSDVRTVTDEAGADKSGDLTAGSDLYGFYLAAGNNEFHLSGLAIDEQTAITVGYPVENGGS